VPELLDFLAPKGADMLVNGIRNRIFVPPLKEVGSQAAEDGLTHAAKITPEDRHIVWQNWTWAQISRRQRVLNPLWNTALAPARQKTGNNGTPKLKPKRIIFDDLEPVPQDTVPGSEDLKLLPGVPFMPSKHKSLFVYTVDGQLLRLGRLKVEGDKFNDALIAAQKARMFSPSPVRFSDVEFSLFHNPLC
jgi:methionyl-tRNA formyltransferase